VVVVVVVVVIMEESWMVLPSHHTAVQMMAGPWSMAEIQSVIPSSL
jgi:hypothetical protein